MCLRIDDNVKIAWKSGGWCYAWKVYFVSDTLYPIHNHRYSPVEVTGNNYVVSDRTSQEINGSDDSPWIGLVYNGIHVFLDRKDAGAYNDSGRALVRVKCFKKDLVAIGTHSGSRHMKQAVFMKVKLSDNSVKEYKVKKIKRKR